MRPIEPARRSFLRTSIAGAAACSLPILSGAVSIDEQTAVELALKCCSANNFRVRGFRAIGHIPAEQYRAAGISTDDGTYWVEFFEAGEDEPLTIIVDDSTGKAHRFYSL